MTDPIDFETAAAAICRRPGRPGAAQPKEGKIATAVIEVSLIPTNYLTNLHCNVCGGWIEKDPVLAEGEQDISLPNNDPATRIVRVCDQCLKGADGLSIDQRLDIHARQLESEAKHTRAMIGRLQVPSYAEWEAACIEQDGEPVHF